MSHSAVLWGQWFERGQLHLFILTAVLDPLLLFHVLHITRPSPQIPSFLRLPASQGKTNQPGKVFAALQTVLQLSHERG